MENYNVDEELNILEIEARTLQDLSPVSQIFRAKDEATNQDIIDASRIAGDNVKNILRHQSLRSGLSHISISTVDSLKNLYDNKSIEKDISAEDNNS